MHLPESQIDRAAIIYQNEIPHKTMIEKTQMSSLDHLKPIQKDFTFDLEGTLNSIVSLTSYVPEDAFTAAILGTQRSGHGADK